MAYLSWEAVHERVRLELGSKDDLQRFGELLQTPLGRALKESLINYGFPGQAEKIPLCTQPKSKLALLRLRQVVGNPLGVRSFFSAWHWAIWVFWRRHFWFLQCGQESRIRMLFWESRLSGV